MDLQTRGSAGCLLRESDLPGAISQSLSSPSSLKLLDNWDTLGSTVGQLQDQLGPATQEFWKNLERKADGLKQVMDAEVKDVKQKVQPFLDEFQKNWQEEVAIYRQKVEPVCAELHESMRLKLQELQEKFGPLAEEFRDRIRKRVDSLRVQLAPHSDRMREDLAQRLAELKDNPTLVEYHTKAKDHLKTIREKATPALQDLGHSLGPMMETVKTQIKNVVDKASETLASW